MSLLEKRQMSYEEEKIDKGRKRERRNCSYIAYTMMENVLANKQRVSIKGLFIGLGSYHFINYYQL